MSNLDSRIETQAADSAPSESGAWSEIIERSVRSTPFGSIQLKIHNGRVVEIETTRKFRPRLESQAFTQDLHEREPS